MNNEIEKFGLDAAFDLEPMTVQECIAFLIIMGIGIPLGLFITAMTCSYYLYPNGYPNPSDLNQHFQYESKY